MKLNYAYCNVHTWRFLTFWLEFQESSRHEMTNKTETLIYGQFWSEARTHSGPHNIMEGKLKRLNERSKVTCRTAKSDYLRLWIAEINNNNKKTLPQTELKSASLYDYMECKKYQVEFWSIFWNICLFNDLFKGGIYQRRQITKLILARSRFQPLDKTGYLSFKNRVV